MTHVSRTRDLKCPWVRAIEYFDRYLNELPISDRAEGRELRLRAPLDSLLSSPGSISVDRDVVTSFAPLSEARGIEHGISIGWIPVGTEALPSFRGTLRVQGTTPKSSRIILDGEYLPPFGSIGKAFDVALGRRIADATGDELLRTIADRIERDYATDEPHISR